MSTIFVKEEELIPGRWYAVAFVPLEGEQGPDWGGAQLLKYLGGASSSRVGTWVDEAGEEVETIWDPILQTRVAPGAADAFALQGEPAPEVTATCAPELANFIDPTGALRKAGLLVVKTD